MKEAIYTAICIAAVLLGYATAMYLDEVAAEEDSQHIPTIINTVSKE